MPDNVPNGTPNEDDILLNSEDPELVVEKETDAEGSDAVASEESDAAASDEEKVTEEDEDEEKPKIPFDRPTVKEIKAKFPTFFTEFPELRDAYFREVEFTKLFPTIEDAKEAFEDNEAFSNLSDAALGGDPVPLLESLEKTDKDAFKTFSSAFLPALFKRDQETYTAVVTPLFENLIRNLFRSSDENIKNTAINVAQFIFGEDGELIASGKKTLTKSINVTEEQKKLQQQRDEGTSKAFRETYSAVETDINKGLKVLILRDFDPNQVFTKFMRYQLADEISRRIHKQLELDESHKAVMSSRWKRAKNNGYTDDDKSKIVSTFLARAKSLIPSVRDKVRAAALGKQTKDTETKIERRAPAPRETNGGRPASAAGSRPKVDYSKMSDLEILNS